MEENEIAKAVVRAAFEIHTELGPGLLESVYEVLLWDLLKRQGFSVERQVELKSVEALANLHKKQVLTYLRLTGLRLGLLINFNAAIIRDGICRIANGLSDEALAKTQRREGL